MNCIQTANREKRIRIRSLFRFCFFLTITLSLLISIISFCINHNSAMIEKEYITVSVCYGDTLWNIASRTKPNGVDIRKYIHEIKQTNSLESAQIKAGQEITVPIYE